MIFALKFNKARISGGRSLWRNLLRSAGHPGFKLRSKVLGLIPPGLRFPLRRVYQRLSSRGRTAASIRQNGLRMLNLGYAERGYRELLAAAEGARDRRLRLNAYWDLLHWHLAECSENDARAVLRYVDAMRQLEVRPERLVHLAIARASALRSLGELERAEAAIRDNSLMSTHPDLVLARATFADVEARKEALNCLFRREGLDEVALLAGKGSAIDRLTAGASASMPQSECPLVSVIIPAFNAEATIATAIRSLQMQTWRNVEIIAVDDCSTDNTAAVVRSMAERDGRVRLLRAQRNSGAYCARNLGLKAARGKYVTCHDADDWSHPRKLQMQAEDLERKTRRTVANLSALLFLDENLRAASRRIGSYARTNTSSLMFRREPVVERLGAWDPVRFAADTEFLERIYGVFGRWSVAGISQPLSLVRIGNGSLTASESFGYHGFRMGARQFYHQRYIQFHRSGKPLRLSGEVRERPFYVPEPMLPWRLPRGTRRCFDVVLVFDCRLGGADLELALNAIGRYRGEGRSVALFHLPLYEPDPEMPVHEAVIKLLDSGLVAYLVPGEHIDCDRLDILGWSLLLDRNRFFIDVRAREITVAVDDVVPGGGAARPSAEERRRCEANLRHYCGASAVWYTLPQ